MAFISTLNSFAGQREREKEEREFFTLNRVSIFFGGRSIAIYGFGPLIFTSFQNSPPFLASDKSNQKVI